MKQHSVAVSAAAGPSRAQPSTGLLKMGGKNASTGIGGLPGGVVGPEAAGLDPSGPEHFFVTLAAYADALDALPLDLTRSFSDLRELDAVLGSHLNSLTARLNHLTALIEDPDIDQGQRLLALKEVAEEARAYKMGGEDKIRVALNTAETIISHTDYIDALDSQLDRFAEISTLLNPTKHLKLDQYYVPGTLKDRKLVSSLDTHTGAASGAADVNGSGSSKKKKVAAHVAAVSAAGGKSHKAVDVASAIGSAAAAGGSSNSKKRKAISGSAIGGSSSGGSAKVAKTSGAGKGDEDVKTAANGSSSHKKKTDGASHSAAGSASKSSQSNSNTRLPRAAHAHIGYTEDDEDGTGGRKDAAARRGGGEADESSSRSRNSRAVRASAAAQRSDDEDEDMDDVDVEEEEEEANVRSSTKSRGRAGARAGASNSRARGAAVAAASPHTGSASASRADSPASNAGGAGDDADEARYCFCNNVSYGDMIGCDDDDCEREWFHLGCVGLTKPPQGTWYCEACLERRAANGRGAKAKKAKSSGSKSKVRR
ncbi:related to p33ING1b (ING1) protein [Sporisorium reilianum SRZ2]|uniref:Chromatin modification-related protein n=1 Tax=Sporisorium reilianum (strain SRZ2) TaxID=999809 RepID=E6ZTN9_SPORE|nr:related to p33ING1b (ING1) protein [Sporisorium reilianum SRZ2]